MELWTENLFFQFVLDFWVQELPYSRATDLFFFKMTFRCKMFLAGCPDGLFTQPDFDNWEEAPDKSELLLPLFHQEVTCVLPVTPGDSAPLC